LHDGFEIRTARYFNDDTRGIGYDWSKSQAPGFSVTHEILIKSMVDKGSMQLVCERIALMKAEG
jgi:hypothetical protein